MNNRELEKEVREKARKLYSDLQKKYKADLAAMYAYTTAETWKMDLTAKTFSQIKKQMIYEKVTEMVNDAIVFTFMHKSGFEYSGENNITWIKKEKGADNGNNSNN